MTTGDLVMFRGSGLVPWIIRMWTRSAWGHCGVLVIVAGVPMVLEARHPDGVALHALEHRMDDQPTLFPTGRMVDTPSLLAQAGSGYSLLDALLAGADEAGRSSGWECAELAAWALGLDHEATGWTPQGLIEALSGKVD